MPVGGNPQLRTWILGAVACLAICGPGTSASAGDPPAAPAPKQATPGPKHAGPPRAKSAETVPPSHISDWIPEDGGVQVGADGVARSIFQPEFRGVPSLLTGMAKYGLKGIVVKPLPPYVHVHGAPAKAAPVPSRLLLVGPDEATVRQARAILRRLDAPPRMAFVSILASEVRRSSRKESGGSLLYDRSTGSNPSNTVFRGFSTSFEPESYLRSNLTGVMPFEGTSVSFGDLDAGGGLFAYTLRMLSHVGCSQFIAWPNLVVSEGRPAVMESLRVVPQTLLTSSASGSVSYIKEQVGLKLRLTAVRIGRETAVLDLDIWLRIPEEADDGLGLVGTLRLKQRQVRTRITLRDREPLMLGGLILHHARRSRRGLPRPKSLAVLDPLHSALACEGRDTEICFLIRMRSVTPGHTPAEMRPTVYRGWSRGETRTDPFGR